MQISFNNIRKEKNSSILSGTHEHIPAPMNFFKHKIKGIFNYVSPNIPRHSGTVSMSNSVKSTHKYTI